MAVRVRWASMSGKDEQGTHLGRPATRAEKNEDGGALCALSEKKTFNI